MNNIVTITYEKNNRYPKICINGEQISRFMSLSNYIYDDIFHWSDQFFDVMDSELAEEYVVELTGHRYHEFVLNNSLCKSQYCEKIVFNDICYTIPLNEKLKYIKEINEKYSLINHTIQESISIHCDNLEYANDLNLTNVSFTIEEQNYSLNIDDNFDNSTAKYQIIICDEECIKRKKGVTYIYTKIDNLQILVDYLNIYHVWLLLIQEVTQQLSKQNTTEKDKLEFEAYINEEHRIMIKSIPSIIDCEESCKVEYEFFPKCLECPTLLVSTSNPEALEYKSGYLVAKKHGDVTVTIADLNGKEYLSQQVKVETHNYVKDIMILLPQTEMIVGETLVFRTIVNPIDAEDAEEIKYEVSDEKVAVISNKNEIYSLSSGRVCIKVSTRKASKKIYISVLPEAKEIILSSDDLKVQTNSRITVYGAVSPSNAKPMPLLTWQSSNKQVLVIKSSDESKCCFETKEPGIANIICKTSDGKLRKTLVVKVSRPGGCYIATSVYGSYDCPQVWVLRRYRDDYLSKSCFGRLFIKIYYMISPKIVKLFGDKKWFNQYWERHLNKMVKNLKKKGYDDTPYEDK